MSAKTKTKTFFKNPLTISIICDIILKYENLGVAQLVARYLGVVEAASSSLVTQTKIGGSTEPLIFFYFLAKSLEISRFRDNDYRHILPFLLGRMCLFFRNDDMLDHTCLF